MMSKSSPNCDQTHIHQLLDLLRYYRILQVSNEEEARLCEMRLNLSEQTPKVKKCWRKNCKGLHCPAVIT